MSAAVLQSSGRCADAGDLAVPLVAQADVLDETKTTEPGNGEAEEQTFTAGGDASWASLYTIHAVD